MDGLHFKHREDEAAWGTIDAFARWLTFSLWYYARAADGVSHLLISSVVTPAAGRVSLTHEEGRAVDVSFREGGLTLETAEAWAEWINSGFYGPGGMKLAVVGKLDPAGRHNDHVHIQTPRPCKPQRRVLVI